MGLTAENVAARYGITRQEMDELALQGHRRAAAAQDAGKFERTADHPPARRGCRRGSHRL